MRKIIAIPTSRYRPIKKQKTDSVYFHLLDVRDLQAEKILHLIILLNFPILQGPHFAQNSRSGRNQDVTSYVYSAKGTPSTSLYIVFASLGTPLHRTCGFLATTDIILSIEEGIQRASLDMTCCDIQFPALISSKTLRSTTLCSHEALGCREQSSTTLESGMVSAVEALQSKNLLFKSVHRERLEEAFSDIRSIWNQTRSRA